MFKDKTLLITGGTGSFGNAVLNRFLNTNIKEIRIFSRDEKKQDDMRHFYHSDKIKYYKGFTNDKGQQKGGSIVSELVSLADTKTDFTEQDIIDRSVKIVTEFIDFLKQKNLVKQQ